MKKCLLIFCLLIGSERVFAQEQLLQVAKQYLLSGNYEKSAATYKQLLEYNPRDKELQKAYMQSLMGLKDYKTAEKALKPLIKAEPKNANYNYQLVKVYKALNEEKKANKLIEKIIDNTQDNDEEVRAIAALFESDFDHQHAIAVYEKGKSFHKEYPYLFAEELALLYDKQGNRDKAIESLLDFYVSTYEKAEEIKATFMRMMAKPAELKDLQSRVEKRMSKEPEVQAYPDLLAWMYIQQKDYEKAFAQIKSIDIKLNEGGRRMLGFARVCLREWQFKAAIIAYDAVAALGKEQPYYELARSEKLTCMKQALKSNPAYTQTEVQTLAKAYDEFLTEFPHFLQRETLREYAELEARYAHDIPKAIELLNNVVKANNVPAALKGRCKLEMGDYELVRDDIWESTLLYSQVDKEFKQDMLGEEARFRNAKLSYYTGDFAWAQGQLDVLKASTSELIANDALNLSVLITENNPPADSNTVPLEMYAKADLLEFQNKDQEALAMLDSITSQFPKHPLTDDIYMERARIAIKKQDFSEAAMLYQKVVSEHAEDILADDALFSLAGINESVFKNAEEAKRLYEQLILKYPGSTFVSEARKNFRRLRGDKADVEDGVGSNF
ncbi:MAG: tetratricopeptide repeat protein [Bacteroidetes bacterium]|nr:tetratricopeptide repeat protein [Bacteroidota bacterium]